MSRNVTTLVFALLIAVSVSFTATPETDAQCFRNGNRCGLLSRICNRRANQNVCQPTCCNAGMTYGVQVNNSYYCSTSSTVIDTSSTVIDTSSTVIDTSHCNRQHVNCVRQCIGAYDPLTNAFDLCLIRCDRQRIGCETASGCYPCPPGSYPATPVNPNDLDLDPDCDEVYQMCIAPTNGTCPCSTLAACASFCMCAKQRCIDQDYFRPCTCLMSP